MIQLTQVHTHLKVENINIYTVAFGFSGARALGTKLQEPLARYEVRTSLPPKKYTRDPETNSEFTPENEWLKDEVPFGFRPIFRGYVYVSVRECSY